MTPKQEAALRQALDCVSTLANARDWVGCTPNERWDEDEMYAELCNATICLKKSLSIIQEALAEQPAQQQEPVVWMYQNKSTHEVSFQKHMRSFVDHGAWYEVPLYSEPLANQEKTSGSPKPAKPEALRLAELFEVAANAAPEGDEVWLKTAAELRRMHDLLGKANALCRIRAEEIERLKAQPEQEPVAWINWCAATGKRSVSFECESELASQPLYEGITQNTQYHYSKFHSWFDSELHRKKYTQDHPAYLAAQEAWNAANDAAQHRINRLNAEIEAWKVRFKIAEDALAKLNGPEQKPVAYGLFVNGELSWDSEWAFSNESFPVQFDDEECRPLYTSSQRKPWVGLTLNDLPDSRFGDPTFYAGAQWAEAKLKEKNA